ncbi:MAG: trimethylamine methyltransferase family protein [Actinobacteria bacterium]|nr:trimethylamine methyltransferase family protein [Actinomycetota bacterium]
MKNPLKVKILSEEEREQIFQGSLEILEKVGIEVEDESLRKIMLKKGCIGSEESNVIKIEKELTKGCINDTDKKPVYKCINGKELHLYGNNRYYGSLIIDPFVLDYERGMRKALLSDVIKHAKLGDALPLVDHIYKMDESCSDVDQRIVNLKTIEAFISNTTTSLFCAPASLDSLKTWVDIAEIAAGDSLIKNPILSAYLAPVSPLFLTKDVGQQLIYCLEKGVLVRGGPCQMAGATAPYTIAGSLVSGIAEMLFMLVAVQLVKRNAPFVAALGGHSIDMKTGNVIYGGPVKDMLHTACLEMVEYLNLPSNFGVFSSLCPNYGVQNGLESAFSSVFTYFSRNHIMGGMGSFGNACGVSAEQILIHHDMVETLKRYDEGIKVDSETLGIESIKKAGIRGNFLTDDLTMKYLKTKEHHLSKFYEIYHPGWDGEKMIEKVHRRVEEIIDSHKPKINQDRVDMINNYVNKKVRETLR